MLMIRRISGAALALALLAAPPGYAATAPVTQIQATQAQAAQSAADAKMLADKLDVLHNDLQALIATLRADGVAGTVATSPAQAGTAVAVDPYFPAKAGDALFPSPENSRIVREADGTTSGKPYLVDKTGAVYRLAPVSNDVPTGLTRNGLAVASYPGVTFPQAIVRQGQVYLYASGGQVQEFRAEMGGVYNTSLPDVATPETKAAAAAEAANPTLPAPSPIAPGSSGRVLKASPGQVAAVLAIAKDGDTLELDGQYAEPVPLINVALLVRLAPGTVVDFTDQALAQGKGGFVPAKDFVLEGAGTVRGAGIKETSAGGTACVRPATTAYVTIRGGVTLAGCQNGVAGGGFPWVLDLVDVTLDGNGLGDGYTHNMYPTDAVRVTLTRVVSRNARGGHAVKARTKMFSAIDSDLSGDETLIDLPNGTATVAPVTNTKLTKTAGAANHRLIGYGEEGASLGVAGMMVTGGTITGGDGSFVQGVGTVTFSGTAFVGTAPTGQGVKLVGLP